MAKKRKTTKKTTGCNGLCPCDMMGFKSFCPMHKGMDTKVTGFSMHTVKCKKGHFFGALLFGIILAVIFNQQGILLSGVNLWLQGLLVFGFAWMMS